MSPNIFKEYCNSCFAIMANKCDNKNCAIADINTEWVNCSGICGKIYHPVCIGLSRKGSSHLKEYLSLFSFYCDECKEISLSHVMMAIKCNNVHIKNLTDSINSITNDNTYNSKKLSGHLRKYDGIGKGIEELNNTVENSLELNNTKFKLIENELAKLNTLIKAKSNNDSQNNTQITELNKEISLIHYSIRNSNFSEMVQNEIKSLRDEFIEHFGNSTKILSNQSTLINDISSRYFDFGRYLEFTDKIVNMDNNLNYISNELTASRLVIRDIVDDIKNMAGTSKSIPNLNLSDCAPPQNVTIHAELQDIATCYNNYNNTSVLVSPHTQNTSITKQPPSTSTTPIVDAVIQKFGTSWTQIEWDSRISKLNNFNNITKTKDKRRGKNRFSSKTSTSNDVLDAYFLRGAPSHADADWLSTFFLSKFSISISNAVKIVPSKRKVIKLSYNCFKLYLPLKYRWLFLNSDQDVFKHGKMRMSLWKDRSSEIQKSSRNKSSSTSNIKNNINSIRNTNNKNNNTSINNTKKKYIKKKYENFIQGQTLNPQLPQISIPDLPSTNSSTKTRQHISTSTTTPNINSINRPCFNLNPIDAVPDTDTINFDHGEILIDPKTKSNTPHISQGFSFLDPLFPPKIKHTANSINSTENRYLLGRLREHRLFEDVRLFLAYLHKQPQDVCVDGRTKTSTLVSIQKEGFPTDFNALKSLYYKYHEQLGISSSQTDQDLAAVESHISSKHSAQLQHLQKLRENQDKLFRPHSKHSSSKKSFYVPFF